MDFQRDIFPILQERCFECHGDKKQKNGLRLDRKADAFRGGDSGDKIFVPGHADQSKLIKAITTSVAEDRMPPKGDPLSPNQINLLKSWINAGAPWPDDVKSPSKDPRTDHWAFKKPAAPGLPEVKNKKWIKNPIDQFILQRLEKEKLSPSPAADRRTLIRRLSLDLIGLPPTPEQVKRFLEDKSPEAYSRLVEDFLASPHFGERWGRHWLDLARYADSEGYQVDHFRPFAWLYRDWVINAYNRDLPYDQFTIDQIAGDLIPEANHEQRIAAGFHRQTLNNREDGVDQEEFKAKALVDRVSTTGTVWLGLTLGCAECHSHKYDPISQREFYQIYAFFKPAQEGDVSIDHRDLKKEFEIRKAGWESEQAGLKRVLERFQKEELPLRQRSWEQTAATNSLTNVVVLATLQKKTDQRSEAEQKELSKFYEGMDTMLKKHQARLSAHEKRQMPAWQEPLAMSFRETTNAIQTFVHVRGDFLSRGEEVQPGVLSVLNPLLIKTNSSTAAKKADRLELARWLVDRENPLAARVAVNHIWKHLFGVGLVNTPEDFGLQGERPSHPELLDWLACELMNRNWSRKEMIRLLVHSAAYQQSSHWRRDLHERDPENRLLGRQHRFRLEAEIVRDIHLASSGLLDYEIGGPSIRPTMPEDLLKLGYSAGIKWVESEGPEKFRRGLYVQTQRTTPYPLPMTFDAADSNITCTRRTRSNTPLQALSLMNNEVFFQCAREAGKRLFHDPSSSLEETISELFERCLSRPPTAEELKRLKKFYHHQLELMSREPTILENLLGEECEEKRPEQGAGAALAHLIMNLDEFVTRE